MPSPQGKWVPSASPATAVRMRCLEQPAHAARTAGLTHHDRANSASPLTCTTVSGMHGHGQRQMRWPGLGRGGAVSTQT